MSCHFDEVLKERGLGYDTVIEDPERFALASIAAGHARTHGQVIERAPDLPHDPAHGHVVGEKPGKIQRSCATGLIG